jgi:hypothetical protein
MPRRSKPSKSNSPDDSTSSVTPVPDECEPNVQWKPRNGFYYPLTASKTDGKTLEVMEFEVSGVVEKCYLKSGAKSHTVVIALSEADVDAIKRLVETSPELNGKDTNYHWPFDGNNAKFASKHDLHDDFQDIWDGREIPDIHDISKRRRLSSSKIVEGCKVLMEYTIVLYGAKRASGNDPGFGSGCSLRLLSIGLLGDGPCDFESPRKKKRVA